MKFILFLMLIVGVAFFPEESAAAENRPPVKGAYFRDDDVDAEHLDKLKSVGINTIIVKIRKGGPTSDEFFRSIDKWVKEANSRNIRIFISLYFNNFPSADLPKGVGASGETFKIPSFSDNLYWERLGGTLEKLAAIPGISGIVVDFESYGSFPGAYPPDPSFSTENLKEFADAEKLDIPAEVKSVFGFLKEKNLMNKYRAFFREKLTRVAKSAAEKARKVNKDIMLGFFPPIFNQENWFQQGILEAWGTEKNPVYVFDEKTYSGNYKGIPDTIKLLQGKNIVYMPGISLEAMFGNTPDLFASQLYFFYKAAGSYWIYNTFQLTEKCINGKVKGFELPEGASPDEYYNAIALANKEIDKSISLPDYKSGLTGKSKAVQYPSIKMSELKPEYYKLLKPGKAANQVFPILRRRSEFLAGLSENEELKLSIRETGGRASGTSYLILSPDNIPVAEGQIKKATNADISYKAKASGVYRIILDAGGNGIIVSSACPNLVLKGGLLNILSFNGQIKLFPMESHGNFRIGLQSASYGETFEYRICDSDGKQIAAEGGDFDNEIFVDCGSSPSFTLTLSPWASGIFEDITLRTEKPCILAMHDNPPEIVSCPPPDDPKCITIEAEDFKGNWNTQMNIPNYSGSGFRTSNAKGIAVSGLSHSINIPGPGKYTVWTRGYIGKPYKRGWHLEINGMKMPGTHNDLSGNGFLWQRVGEMNLDKGPAEMKILDDDTGLEAPDTILLTTDPAFDPTAREKYFRVLENSPVYKTMAFDRLKEYAAKCYKKFNPPADEKSWDARASFIQAALREKIGIDKLPPNAELNAKITGINQFDGYRVENILLESIRGIYITANLYIPDNIAGKTLPAVVVACGHSFDNGKTYEIYQCICVGLAKQGIIAIIFDPIGQGERKTEGNSHWENLFAIMTGLTVNAIMIRDSQRIVDYLLTRMEVDPGRIGFTGTSGGGMNTLYTLPFEKRIKAAAVSSYFCGYSPFVATGWGHCVCSFIPGAAADFEEWEVLALNAPRPVLLHQGPTDYAFPVKDAIQGYQNAQQIYSFKKAGSDIGIFIASDKQVNGKITNPRWMGHGFHPPAREAVYGFFDKYLKNSGNGAPFPEPEIKTLDTCGNKTIPEQLRVLADGKLPGDSVSFHDLITDRWLRIKSGFPAFKTEQDWNRFKKDALIRIRPLLNIQDNAYRSEKRKTENISDNVCVERIVLTSENGIPCPALFLKTFGNTNKNPTVMIITDRKAQLVDNKEIIGLIANGFNVFAFEPRAMGELAENNHCINISTGIGSSISNGVLGCDSILYGVPLMGQRINDTLAALKYLRSRDDVNPEKLGLAAENLSCSWIAVYAAALDGHVQSLAVNALPTSFTHVLNHRSQLGWDTLVPGICEVLDAAHLAGMQAPRNLLWLNPVADQESQNQLKEIYDLSGAKKNLLFKTLKNRETPLAATMEYMRKTLP